MISYVFLWKSVCSYPLAEYLREYITCICHDCSHAPCDWKVVLHMNGIRFSWPILFRDRAEHRSVQSVFPYCIIYARISTILICSYSQHGHMWMQARIACTLLCTHAPHTFPTLQSPLGCHLSPTIVQSPCLHTFKPPTSSTAPLVPVLVGRYASLLSTCTRPMYSWTPPVRGILVMLEKPLGFLLRVCMFCIPASNVCLYTGTLPKLA